HFNSCLVQLFLRRLSLFRGSDDSSLRWHPGVKICRSARCKRFSDLKQRTAPGARNFGPRRSISSIAASPMRSPSKTTGTGESLFMTTPPNAAAAPTSWSTNSPRSATPPEENTSPTRCYNVAHEEDLRPGASHPHLRTGAGGFRREHYRDRAP